MNALIYPKPTRLGNLGGRLARLLLATLLVLEALTAQAQYAYVTNGYDNTASVIRLSDNAVVATVPAGTTPGSLAITPDGSRVYIGNYNQLVVIQTANNAIITTIPLAANFIPSAIAFSPDGGRMYVTSSNLNQVLVIQTSDNTTLATLNVGLNPSGLAVSADGSRVYAAVFSSHQVAVIQTSDNTVLAPIPLGPSDTPSEIVLTPDGSRAYVTEYNSQSVSVILLATNAVVATIPVGTQPSGVTISPDGSRVYVANEVSNSVSVINTATNAVVTTIPVGTSPGSVGITPDGSRVYVVNVKSDNVSVINTATNTVGQTLTVGDNPYNIAIQSGCVKPTIGFSATGTGLTASASNSGGAASLSVKLCAGSDFKFSGFSRSAANVGVLESIPSGTGNVTYAGNLVPIPRAQTDLGTAATPGFFAGTYGPYALSSGSSGTIDQVFTPYTDVNNDGDYDAASDCLGDPITLHFILNAPPTVSFSGLALSYCANAASVTLTGTPPGGSFSGTGISGNTFTPASAGVGGPYPITYSYTDGTTGCGNSATQTVSITQPFFTQQPTLSQNLVVCANQTVSFTFSVNCPANASFTAQLSDPSGNFVSGTQNLGSVTPGVPNVVTIPGLNTTSSANYRLRVVGSNPTLYSDPTGVFKVFALEFNSNPTVNLVAVCAGASIKVSFTVSGNCAFLPGNAFSAELSNANGSFSSPVGLGSVSPGINTLAVPPTTPGGGGYRIRIHSTAPNLVSGSSAAFTVNQPAFVSTPTVNLDNKCPGEAVKLSFSVGCAFFAGNTFTAQLSDKTGSFGGAVNVGTVAPGMNNVVIPVGTPAGTGYKLRLVSSNPVVTSAVSASFKVKACGQNREISPEETGLQVVVSPNPATDGRLRIQISGAEGQALRVELFNGTGLPLRQQAIGQAGEAEVLDWDIAARPAGLYLLRVVGAKDVKTVKVLRN